MTTPETYVSLLSTWNTSVKTFRNKNLKKCTLYVSVQGATGATILPSLCGNEAVAALVVFPPHFAPSLCLFISLLLLFYCSSSSYCLQASSSFFTLFPWFYLPLASPLLLYYCFIYSLYSIFFSFVSLSLFTSLYFIFSPSILFHPPFTSSVLFSIVLFLLFFPFSIIKFLFNSAFLPCSFSVFPSSSYSYVFVTSHDE